MATCIHTSFNIAIAQDCVFSHPPPGYLKQKGVCSCFTLPGSFAVPSVHFHEALLRISTNTASPTISTLYIHEMHVDYYFYSRSHASRSEELRVWKDCFRPCRSRWCTFN